MHIVYGGRRTACDDTFVHTATTRLRLLLANIMADAGSARDVIEAEFQDESDRTYLTRELERLQATAHRIVAFLDEDVVNARRH